MYANGKEIRRTAQYTSKYFYEGNSVTVGGSRRVGVMVPVVAGERVLDSIEFHSNDCHMQNRKA